MEELWGKKVAGQCHDRGLRSAFRQVTKRVVMLDASYNDVIQLEGPEDSLKAAVGRVTCPSELFRVRSNFVLQGSKAVTSVLYDDIRDYPFGAVAEVTWMWRPRSKATEMRSLWVIVHPSATECAFEILQKHCQGQTINAEIFSRQLNIFTLMGPKSNEILSMLKLSMLKLDSSSGAKSSAVFKAVTSASSPAELPDHLILSLTVEDPRLTFPPKNNTRSLLHSPAAQPVRGYCSNTDSGIWDATTRSTLRDTGTFKSFVNDKASAPVPILLVQRPQSSSWGGKFGSGWHLIVPGGWAMAFWNSLVFAGARPVGQLEMTSIYDECGALHFPRDFPDTLASEELYTLLHAEKESRYLRKPPAKRPNYQKLRIDSPFRTRFDSLFGTRDGEHQEGENPAKKVKTDPEKRNFCVLRHRLLDIFAEELKAGGVSKIPGRVLERALIRVSIRPLYRGVPVEAALICGPSDADITKLNDENCSFHGDRETLSSKTDSAPSRKVIGYISSGLFSLVRGRGHATGFVTAMSLREMTLNRKKNDWLVMTRNPSCPVYRPALVSIDIGESNVT